MNGRILIGVAPFVGESLHSILQRIAAENLLSGPRDILSAVGLSSPSLTMSSEVTALARICRLDERLVAALCVRDPESRRTDRGRHRHVSYFNSRVPADQLLKGASEKVCPMCIREQGYTSGVNAFKFVTACPVHGIRLLDQCQDCERPISTVRPRLEQCSCGAVLSDMQTSQVSGDEVNVARLVVRAWKRAFAAEIPGPCAGIRDEFNNLRLEDLLTALSFLYHLEQATRSTLGGDANSMRVRHLGWRVERVGHLLTEWPHAFHGRLVRVRTSLARSTYSERMEGAGSISYRLFADLPGSQFAFIHRAYLDFVERKLRDRT